MNSSNFPMISLDISSARHSIKIALGEHMDKVQEDLNVAIDHAVDNFDFQGLVTSVITDVLTEQIETRLSKSLIEVYNFDELMDMVNRTLIKIIRDKMSNINEVE